MEPGRPQPVRVGGGNCHEAPGLGARRVADEAALEIADQEVDRAQRRSRSGERKLRAVERDQLAELAPEADVAGEAQPEHHPRASLTTSASACRQRRWSVAIASR